uniref:Uncharacterized protein n=1 Tax=Plectus sambesii TaxID=2011161 RepID=A0A914UGK9_9BILA
MFEWIYAIIWAFISSYLVMRLYNGLWVIVRLIYLWYIRPKLDLSPYKNLWTVVTGGTDGIGKAYTIELARRGMRKFMLIGRNPSKLKNVADILKRDHKCEVETYVFDFANDDLKQLPKQLTEYEIGILVNCAGVAVEKIERLTEHEEGLASSILQVNLMSTVKMIELVMPGMVARDRGIVVNVASITGWRPLPYMSAYPASKAGVTFFSQALYEEYAKTNVKVQCLVPILVATKLASYDGKDADGYVVISPETYAKDAVDVIGYRNCTGSKAHEVQIALLALFSFWLFKVLFVPLVLLTLHKNRMTTKPAEKKVE